MECINCKEEFEGNRITAKYCSDACKLAYHRKGVSVSNDTVRIPENVTVKLKQIRERGGRMYKITKLNRYWWTYFNESGVREGGKFEKCEFVG